MTTTPLFSNNRSQAVRLPKAVAFPPGVRAVTIRVEGQSRVLTPADGGWAEWFARPGRATDDFLAERDQGAAEERTAL
ncbi:MAG: antitoxin [Bifidobacteriaceae bacterium]|jgi:antitoxin VapB|nr:antitoxin [Bifidobacteriaceae bacterium]